MKTTICIVAKSLYYPNGGGHLWVYLNWALGLKALDAKIIWLERVSEKVDDQTTINNYELLKSRLEHYGLEGNLALYSTTRKDFLLNGRQYPNLEYAVDNADILLNFYYPMPEEIVRKFKKSVMIDIDPGLTQLWISSNQINLARHDYYFTTGETVGRPHSWFPDCGLSWHYTPPCVHLPSWPIGKSSSDAFFTTVSHWHACEWVGDAKNGYLNDKRTGFLPFLDLPKNTKQKLELMIHLRDDPKEEQFLKEKGWHVRESNTYVATPEDYQRYVQNSKGEFSCAKPSCIKLQNAWISDRSLCYLASGKPVIVQHTGESKFLPTREGLFRFKTMQEAKDYLNEADRNYHQHSLFARKLTEDYFDAVKVTGTVLDKIN